MHPDDPESEDNIPTHTMKGARSVFLLNAGEDVPELPANTKTFDFLMNKVTVVVTRVLRGYLEW